MIRYIGWAKNCSVFFFKTKKYNLLEDYRFITPKY